MSELYFEIKKDKGVNLSLRNLSRALVYINRNKDVYGLNRAIYDGLMLGYGCRESLKELECLTEPKSPLT